MGPTKRKGKKNTLHRALQYYDRGQLLSVMSSNGIEDGKDALEVMNWLRKTREAFGSNISALQGAVSLGHYNICKILIEEGASMNSISHLSHPLCLAFEKSHEGIAHLLLESAADVNLHFEGKYPMAFALEYKKCSISLVKAIIDAGFPKNGIVHRPTKRTALHTAVLMNHIHIVKYLFSLSVDPNVRDLKGLSPLHYAAQKDYSAIAKILAKNGAKLDFECEEHFTPMMYAIAVSNYNMVKTLIQLGADIHYINGSKKCPMTPLHFAAKICQFKIVQLLLEKGADKHMIVDMTGETALHAAARGDTRNMQLNKVALDCIVELLVREGCDLDIRRKYGFTPLQVAIKANNLSVAKILIINGSQLNNKICEVENNCYTTFHLAAKHLEKDFTKLCLEYGADPKVQDEEGMYPIHLTLLAAMLETITHSNDCSWSGKSDHTEILKLFWKYNFPYDLTLKLNWFRNDNPPYPERVKALLQKQRMLFSGLKSMQLKIVEKAISQGAEVKSCSTDVPYPIHFIASQGNDLILKQFVSRGVQVNVLDKRGETPLHAAAKMGYINCCRILLEYGACYNITSHKCPKTPLQMAKENNQTEVVKLLTTIDKNFEELKKGHFKKFTPDMKIFSATMNCCCRDGSTLTGKAIQLHMKEIAERLMKLRLETS